MKNVICIFIVSLILVGCNENKLLDSGQTLEERNFEELSIEEISLEGVDRLSIGGTFQEVIRTQDEYDQLIYERFQKPLDDYCNSWFPEIRQELEQQHPELSPEEIQQILNQRCITRTPVFKGLENVKHPEFDFSKYTLLGQDAHASGCRKPDYDISLTSYSHGIQYEFYVLITQYGLCSMAIDRNLWIIAPRIPEESEVVFEKEYLRIEQ